MSSVVYLPGCYELVFSWSLGVWAADILLVLKEESKTRLGKSLPCERHFSKCFVFTTYVALLGTVFIPILQMRYTEVKKLPRVISLDKELKLKPRGLITTQATLTPNCAAPYEDWIVWRRWEGRWKNQLKDS